MIASPMTYKEKYEGDERTDYLRRQQRENDPYEEVLVNPKKQTLQSLALAYNVPLSELKRLNNLFNEKEFFAVRTLKIPLGNLSTLEQRGVPNHGWKEQRVPELVQLHSLTPEVSCSSPEDSSDQTAQTAFPKGRTNAKELRKANKIFKTVDKELTEAKLRLGVDPGLDEESGEDESGEEDSALLNNTNPAGYLNLMRKRDGRSWGCCVLCIACIVISIVLILLFAKFEFDSIERDHNSNNNNDDSFAP